MTHTPPEERIMQLQFNREEALLTLWGVALLFAHISGNVALQFTSIRHGTANARALGQDGMVRLSERFDKAVAAAFPEAKTVDMREQPRANSVEALLAHLLNDTDPETCKHCQCDPGDSCCYCGQPIPPRSVS